MAAAGAISCSVNAESQKSIKSWREAVKYLPRVDRAGVLKRVGSVLTLDQVALRRAIEREYAGQRQRKGAAVECSNSGVAHSSRSSRGGDHPERRDKERRERESLRDQRTVLQVLVRSLNPAVDGSDPRTLETTESCRFCNKWLFSSSEEGRKIQQKAAQYIWESPHIHPID